MKVRIICGEMNSFLDGSISFCPHPLQINTRISLSRGSDEMNITNSILRFVLERKAQRTKPPIYPDTCLRVLLQQIPFQRNLVPTIILHSELSQMKHLSTFLPGMGFEHTTLYTIISAMSFDTIHVVECTPL